MKRLPYFAYLLVTFFCLSACSAIGTNDENYETQETTIQIATPKGIVSQNMINQFMVENPNIKVERLEVGHSYEEIKSYIINRFSTGEYPDIAFLDIDNIGELFPFQKLVDFKKYIENETYGLTQEEQDDFYEPFLKSPNSYSKDGIYYFPYLESTDVMYYNASILIGLDLSSIDSSINSGKPLNENYINNLTWEELFDHLIPAMSTYEIMHCTDDKKLFKNDEKDGAFLTYTSDSNLFINLATQYDYGYTSIDNVTGKINIEFNNDNMKALVKKLKKIKGDYYLDNDKFRQVNTSYWSNQSIFPIYDAMNLGGGNVKAIFESNQALFAIENLKYLPLVDKSKCDIRVAKLPHPEGKQTKSVLQNYSLFALDKGSEAKKIAARKLCKFLTNAENSAKLVTDKNYLPLRKSIQNTEIMQNYISAQMYNSNNLFKDIYSMRDEIINNSFNTAVFNCSSTARKSVGDIIRGCLLSQNIDTDIEKYFKAAENEVLVRLKN